MGLNDDISHYGIPEFGRPGIKASQHVTHAANDDPDDPPDERANECAMKALEALLREQFRPRIKRVAGIENCLYTNTRSEDFIMDRHPRQERVVIGAGFSGHGFKLGPVSGRILAELALQGTTSLPEFERARGRELHSRQSSLRSSSLASSGCVRAPDGGVIAYWCYSLKLPRASL